ncbi:unnamed protein product [Dicrocoelium dendriticum]|nr:unnamed protein product [Dicrocoelium dendriticum]
MTRLTENCGNSVLPNDQLLVISWRSYHPVGTPDRKDITVAVTDFLTGTSSTPSIATTSVIESPADAESSVSPPRTIALDITRVIEKQIDSVIDDFHRLKLVREIGKNWDLFYKRNGARFFKDRHWSTREFGDLLPLFPNLTQRIAPWSILEVGCGVGNFLIPLLEDLLLDGRQSTSLADVDLSMIHVFACDISIRAISLLRERAAECSLPCTAFVCDVCQPDSLKTSLLQSQSDSSHSLSQVDVVTLIFVLSAVSPWNMVTFLKNIVSVLKPGGRVLLRDYGLHDHAQLRFGRGTRFLPEVPAYARQDGTLTYYFSVEELNDLLLTSGLHTLRCEYIYRQLNNVAEGISVQRVFVQAVAERPL